MTDEHETPPTETPDPGAGGAAPRRLLRSRDDRVLGGVAGGLGRYFDVDPIIFRIGLAVLVLFGGVGAIAYLAALLFVPEDDGSGGPAPAAERSRALTIAAAVGLAIAALIVLDDVFWVFDPWPWLGFALLAAVAVAIVRMARGGERERSSPARIALIALVGVLALAGGAVLALGSAWAGAEGLGEVVAGLVILIGVALIVAAFTGGARWLVLPALLLAAPLGVVAAADFELEGGYGERHYRPASVASLPPGGYDLGVGELTIDLRDLDWRRGTVVDLELDLGMGEAVVAVPEEVCVETEAQAGIGAIEVLGADTGGIDVDHDAQPPAGPAPRLRLDAEIGMGALDVDHELAGRSFDHGPGWRDEDGADDEQQRLAAAACEAR